MFPQCYWLAVFFVYPTHHLSSVPCASHIFHCQADGSIWEIVQSAIPLRGTLEFDFVPRRDVAVSEEPMTPTDFEAFLVEVLRLSGL